MHLLNLKLLLFHFAPLSLLLKNVPIFCSLYIFSRLFLYFLFPFLFTILTFSSSSFFFYLFDIHRYARHFYANSSFQFFASIKLASTVCISVGRLFGRSGVAKQKCQTFFFTLWFRCSSSTRIQSSFKWLGALRCTIVYLANKRLII